jgi:putative ABC transport system substrate-binding protein
MEEAKPIARVESSPPPVPLDPKPKRNMFPWTGISLVLVLVAVVIGILFMVNGANKQATAPKIYHVGILSGIDFFLPMAEGFKQKMTELGYVEGKNIVYDLQKAPNIVGNQSIIKKFVDDKVDLIFVYPTEPSLEAKDGTKGTDIPIISTGALVEGNGLIESISHPGENITGVRFPVKEVAAKRLELLNALAPKAKRIMVPYLKDYPTVAPALLSVKSVAASLDLTIIEVPLTSSAEIKGYFDTLSAKKDIGVDAILEVPEPISLTPEFQSEVYKFADIHKLPVAGAIVMEANYGPIFGLIPSPFEFGRLAAPLAVKIFNGTKAGTIPMLTPESEFTVNYKVITKLGLVINEGLLSTAKKIVR